ncbi:SIMPL domain-containing protein [Pontibacter vulgaris]|uniref:SIMPL domain-containing protein n=1 Tax=Pontibacter vulgaris TaxID=2905679 RepID=UPI001FA7D07B|nr:SIMPL domain-containing protein [Pontibacter vulgaris]
MKKNLLLALIFITSIGLLSSCETRNSTSEDNYIEVIGEYEQPAPDAGYRLNLSYNGPISLRPRFQKWADSLQQQFPSMTKMNENIFLNYMPEQMGKNINRNMYQIGVSYNLTVSDTASYNRITREALKRNIPFNLNVTGSFIEPGKRLAVQKEMLQKAIENAKSKIETLKGTPEKKYVIVSMEEIDSSVPYNPEYYDFNRRMVARIKVKARLQ